MVRQNRVWGINFLLIHTLASFGLFASIFYLKIHKMLKKQMKLKQASRLWLQWERWVGRMGGRLEWRLSH